MSSKKESKPRMATGMKIVGNPRKQYSMDELEKSKKRWTKQASKKMKEQYRSKLEGAVPSIPRADMSTMEAKKKKKYKF